MADAVDTSIYKNVGAGNTSMSPLQVLQLVATSNLTKMQQQEINARNGLAEAYADNPNPDLSTLGRMAGYQAGPAINQQVINTTAQSQLHQAQQDIVQRRIGAISAMKNPTLDDLTNLVVQGAHDNPSIPAQMWTDRLDEARAVAGANPNALKSWGVKQAVTAPSFDATKTTSGPPGPENEPTNITTAAQLQNITQPGGMQAGLSPAVTAATAAAGQASGEASAKAVGAAGNYRSSITPLTKIVHLLDTVGPTGQGIGTEATNSIKNLGVGLGLLKPDTTLPIEELKKYYTQNVLRNADIGSTDKMISAFHGNPNIDLNTASASDLAKTDLALRRMSQAQALEGAEQPKQNYQAWAAKFNNNQDPAAYGFDLMSASNQRKYLASLKPGSVESQRFRNSLTLAHKWQLLEKPNAGQ